MCLPLSANLIFDLGNVPTDNVVLFVFNFLQVYYFIQGHGFYFIIAASTGENISLNEPLFEFIVV